METYESLKGFLSEFSYLSQLGLTLFAVFWFNYMRARLGMLILRAFIRNATPKDD